jgi:hypothetical protein
MICKTARFVQKVKLLVEKSKKTADEEKYESLS